MTGPTRSAAWIVFAIVLAPASAIAQDFFADAPAIEMPTFGAGSGSRGVVSAHPASAEVLATPAAQSREYFDGPTAAGPGARLAPPLDIPDSELDCCEDGPRGRQCQVDRYETKPTGINPDCLICVKEPRRVEVPVTEQVEVVVYRCFETTVPFAQDGCEDGTWFKKKGEKQIRRLRPCTVKVNLKYNKKVIKYVDVWYHVRCD